MSYTRRVRKIRRVRRIRRVDRFFRPHRFQIVCAREDDPTGTWTEDYHVRCSDVWAWAERMVLEFNKEQVRRGNSGSWRILVDVRIGEGNAKLKHDFRKTNLVTIMRGKQSYDTYACKYCGATAKRYGLDPDFILDKRQPVACK